jgi:hypothetical protein
MDYAQLTAELTRLAPFESAVDARLALASSLQTLGFLLPEHLVETLAAALPDDCASALHAGREENRRAAHSRALEGVLPRSGQTLERIQEICGALAKLLPSELVGDLVRELPPPLARAFDGATAHHGEQAAHEARVRPETRHVSEARPGSAHSLASARPRGAQQESVATANPHRDTKLSSARGLTQEREGETLAETSALRRRAREQDA